MPQLLPLNYKWEVVKCNQYPPGRIGHTFCANDEGTKAYVYGGVSDADEVSSYLGDFWEYDTEKKTWTQKELTGSKQYDRAFHTAVWYNNKIYVFGGCNGRCRFNKLFTITADGYCEVVETGEMLPTTRYCHTAVMFEGGMYIFAGKCGGRNSNKRLSDLLVCNLSTTHTWTRCVQTGEIPPFRSAHAALTYGRTMMIFGGRSTEGQCCDDFYLYHFDTCVWRKVNYPTSHPAQHSYFGRARNSAVVHNGSVIVFGGWNGKKKLNDLFIYNVEANVFDNTNEQDPNCPSRRECHVAVMCRDTMVVFGGRFRGTFMSDTTELYIGPRSMVGACETGWRRIICQRSTWVVCRSVCKTCLENTVGSVALFEKGANI
ncbi:Kelchcontaining protein [Angomonas deanei]|nr:Kelchcontaining protein [Angomonas deanei]|eukprot:EPY31346.1 Kelchcontaining protein [Angomonas deanei]